MRAVLNVSATGPTFESFSQSNPDGPRSSKREDILVARALLDDS